MSGTVTFRLDPETARILRDLTRSTRRTKSQVIKEALRACWKASNGRGKPTSWEIYSRLYSKLEPLPPGEPKRDRARHVKRLLREMLLAKKRAGTL